MLSSITPLGERGRAQRYAVTVVAYVVASVAGGTATGAVLGSAGGLLHLSLRTSLFAAAFVLAMAALVDGRLSRRVLPLGHRQVDERWLGSYRGWVYGAGFGVQLGSGAVTIVTTALVPAAGALALLTGSPASGALVGAAFGAARSLPLLAARGVRSPAELRAVTGRVAAAFPVAARVAVVTASVAAAASAAIAAVGA
ncbi:MAG: hypothetical protein QOK14_187 [Frankiaceae bacterium]|nr:hypothetical protein [Frankiaceae bacterium]